MTPNLVGCVCRKHNHARKVSFMDYCTTLPLDLPWPADLPCAVDLTALITALSTLSDQRAQRGIRYPLAPMLAIAILAKLCGESQIEALADWAHHRADGLIRLFGLTRPTMPHARTWGRIFAHAVDPTALTACIAQALRPHDPHAAPQRGTQSLILDGKTLCGTIPCGSTQGVHLVAVFDPASGVVVAQQAVPQKTNEITVAPQLLAAHDLTGVVVTGDAMQCQRALSTQIRTQGGDYCWVVKGNQPDLLGAIEQAFAPIPPLPGWSNPPLDMRAVTVWETGHGRLERRDLRATTMLTGYTDWPGLGQVMEYQRRWWDAAGRERCETRYGVTSLPAEVAGPRHLLTIMRGEWAIENALHYRRDESLREDRSLARRGQSPSVLAVLNNAVIGLLTRAKRRNLPKLQREMDAKVTRWLDRVAG